MASGLTVRRDYWPDYYQFLGITRDADEAAIKAAVRKLFAATHDDANQFATDGIKTVLKRIHSHAEAAKEVLLNAELKAKFDAFLAEHPDRIAEINEEGITVIPAILPLYPEEVDLDALLTGQYSDKTGFAERALQLAGASTGAAKSLTALRIAYKAQSDNDEVKAAYKEALVAAYTEVMMQLGVSWGDAGMEAKMHGVAHAKLFNVHAPENVIAEEIEEAAEQIIPQAVQTRADRLLADQSAPPLLLPAPDGSHQALTSITKDDMDRAVTLAKEAFLARTHRIKELHKKRAGLMVELLDLSAHYEMNPVDSGNEVIVHLVNDLSENPPRVMLSAKVKVENGEIAGYSQLHEADGMTVEEAKAVEPQVRSIGIGVVPECLEQLESIIYHALHRAGALKSANHQR